MCLVWYAESEFIFVIEIKNEFLIVKIIPSISKPAWCQKTLINFDATKLAKRKNFFFSIDKQLMED